MEITFHGYSGDKTETYKLKTLNPVVIWGEPRVIFCELVDGKDLQTPVKKVEK
jgi:hypothetical protein